ncbi:MAG TPA: class I SAM-dependent methyltransferase [Acetobacteraceae bacterium]|jgi:SAM-dependent methyltransferase|nr:class I SAM-dependent methyltransferase [Acetobacteraceae bacterium]
MEPAEYALMDEAEGRMWWYRALHQRLLDALMPVRGQILDAGCGTGGFLAVLKRQRPDLTGFGLEWDHTAAARAKAKSAALVARGSVNALPFAAAAFDAVVSADVLCHAAVDPSATLAELRRVLKPGGRLVLNLPSYQWLMSAHDRHVHNARRFTARAAAALLRQAGFARIQTGYWNGLLLPLMIAQRKILARGDSVSDVAPFPPWLDVTLHAITKTERHLPVSLPFGGSVLAIAERP